MNYAGRWFNSRRYSTRSANQFHSIYASRVYKSTLALVMGFMLVLPVSTVLSPPPQLISFYESITHKTLSIPSKFQQWKKRIVGRYENRIRSFSHPYKVFQYFASVRKNGSDYMTPDAFIRSLQPYIECRETASTTPKELDEYRKLKTRSALEFFKLADTDGDGLIDFKEYMFFITLIMIPSHQVESLFHSLDTDQNQTISSAEFKQLIHPDYDSSAYFSRMGRREFQSIQSHECHGINRLFFGKDGKGSVNMLGFQGFMHQLRYQVMKLEFFQNYKPDAFISIAELITLLIGYTESHLIDKCMMQLNKHSIPSYLLKDRVHFNEFVDVNYCLGYLDDVYQSLAPTKHDGPLLVTRDQILDAFLKASGRDLNPAIIDGLIYLLHNDPDPPNLVDFHIFKKVLGHRITFGLDIPRDIGFGRLVSRVAAKGNMIATD